MGPHTHADGSAPGYFGVYPAVVTNLVDPERLARIEVRFPWLGADGNRDVRAWATLCSPYADGDQGLQILPEKESQVVVAFEAGHLRRPYIVGCTWNGTAPLPTPATRANNLRTWKTRSGSRLEFDDGASPKVTVRTPTGHQVTLDDAGTGTVTVQIAGGATVRVTANSVDISALASVSVKAASVNVDAAVATFSGIVQCQVLQASAAVASPVYSPGVCNLL
ncbi:phage baseplate assembly protein V [Streptomyces phaeochromogenes]|uniref:phage baseplate assembly protein V n=1 Tax=Streptomyces phaeochromogenes TaxID=1923 RepID=UPI002E145639|nr:phage baseplate assembly protein V [Streptomyces phaeochromogenes]